MKFHLPDAITHAICEDDGTPTPATTQTTQSPALSTAIPMPYIPGPCPITTFPPGGLAAPAAVPGDDKVYQNLKTKTDFDSTPVGKVLAEVMTQLADLPVDEKTKLKTALNVGKTKGLTPEAITSTLANLKTVLTQEQDRFTQASSEYEDQEITSRQNRIKAINDEIAALTAQIQNKQKEQSDLSTEVYHTQTTMQTAASQFQMAFTTRNSELDILTSKYTNLLT